MRNTREWTCKVLEAMDQGLLDPKVVAEMAMSYMSESEVEDMCRVNDLKEFLGDEEEDEEDPEDALDDFNYVGSRHHY
jgi:hypothetical protein